MCFLWPRPAGVNSGVEGFPCEEAADSRSTEASPLCPPRSDGIKYSATVRQTPPSFRDNPGAGGTPAACAALGWAGLRRSRGRGRPGGRAGKLQQQSRELTRAVRMDLCMCRHSPGGLSVPGPLRRLTSSRNTGSRFRLFWAIKGTNDPLELEPWGHLMSHVSRSEPNAPWSLHNGGFRWPCCWVCRRAEGSGGHLNASHLTHEAQSSAY